MLLPFIGLIRFPKEGRVSLFLRTNLKNQTCRKLHPYVSSWDREVHVDWQRPYSVYFTDLGRQSWQRGIWQGLLKTWILLLSRDRVHMVEKAGKCLSSSYYSLIHPIAAKAKSEEETWMCL